YLRFPTKLAAGLRRVDGVAEVVTGTVGDKSDQRPSRTRRRHMVIEDVTYRLDDSEVGAFAVAAEIVLRAGTAAIDQACQSDRGRPGAKYNFGGDSERTNL